jgi:hypothetical protein
MIIYFCNCMLDHLYSMKSRLLVFMSFDDVSKFKFHQFYVYMLKVIGVDVAVTTALHALAQSNRAWDIFNFAFRAFFRDSLFLYFCYLSISLCLLFICILILCECYPLYNVSKLPGFKLGDIMFILLL